MRTSARSTLSILILILGFSFYGEARPRRTNDRPYPKQKPPACQVKVQWVGQPPENWEVNQWNQVLQVNTTCKHNTCTPKFGVGKASPRQQTVLHVHPWRIVTYPTSLECGDHVKIYPDLTGSAAPPAMVILRGGKRLIFWVEYPPAWKSMRGGRLGLRRMPIRFIP